MNLLVPTDGQQIPIDQADAFHQEAYRIKPFNTQRLLQAVQRLLPDATREDSDI